MGSLFGGDTDPIAAPDYSQMDPLIQGLYRQINNNNQEMFGQQTPGQAQFEHQARQSLTNTLQGQAAQRGVRSSQLATMGNNALANQQSELAGQAAIRDAMEREAAQNQLASILMQQQGQIASVNQANAGIDQQNKAATDRMLGMGLTAAGYAFGGPAGGMAAGALAGGLSGGGGGGGAPTNMGTNPYAGMAPASQSMQYNPNNYNMGQGLKLNGGSY